MKICKNNLIVLLFILLLPFIAACGGADESLSEEERTSTEIILATTTSTENSGLLDYLLPEFESQHGIDVRVVAVGTGAALQMGVDGEADVLLAHATEREKELVAAGDTIERFDVMYNDFIIIGPASDPAGLRTRAQTDTLIGFQLIAENEATFVSRADYSGTHIMELNLWEDAGVGEPSGSWYMETGQGMGDVLQIANELEGYALADRATYLSMQEILDLEIMLEGDKALFNQYGVMAVNPDKGEHISFPAAQQFIDWILAPETQDLIAAFGLEEFGEPLFFPNAN